MNFYWLLPIFVLWIGWTKECEGNSSNSSVDLSDVPGLLNKFQENVGAFAGTGGSVLQKYGVISEKAAAIAGLMTPMGALISTLIGVFSPAPGSAELEAINHLTRMVDRRFDEMNKRIDRAVAEIKHHIDIQAWTSRVREPLINLRGGAMRMLKNNFSNSSCANMVELCKVGLDSNPIKIVRFMWAQLGANCTSKKIEHCTPENRLNCTSSYIGELCVVDNALKAKNYSNDVAEYIYNSSTFAFAELATYQTICSSFKTEEDRKESNVEFNDQAKELLEQLPKIIIDAVANGYWSHVTADFAQQFMGGPNTKKNADKAYEALEQHYWWYCHNLFTFVHGELGGYPEISTYGFYTWQPLVITKTVGHEDKKDRIVFTRYRCASDADDESVNNNWKHMDEWLDQPAGGGDNLGQKIDRELSIGDDKRQAVEDICNAYGGVYKEGRNAQAFSIYTPHHRTYDAFDGTGCADCCDDPTQDDCDDASRVPCTIIIGGEPYPDGGANMMIFGA